MKYGLINKPLVPIWGDKAKIRIKDGKKLSTIADEGIYGTGVQILEEGSMMKIKTHYGYSGYIEKENLTFVEEKELIDRENYQFMVVSSRIVDITNIPSVQGIVLNTLYRGSIVEVLDFEEEPGWAKIKTLDNIGYIRNIFLCKKKFSQSFLWTNEIPFVLPQEEEFRKNICNRVKTYEEIQYRWAGKTPLGLDCSGLTSMSYMLEGVLIYRDANIMEGWPIKEIPLKNVKPGDLLYFPGHIALYLGEDQYIHSTGHVNSGGVVYNSLNPSDSNYRDDLKQSLTQVGSIF